MHRVDPLGNGGVDLLHPFRKQVVVFTQDFTLGLVTLCLVALGQQGSSSFFLIGFHLGCIILGLLILTLLLLIAGRIDRGGL